MSTPRIAIAVPTYQHGRYLRATLESLATQSVPPAEIVVSDNHSTDETAEVLARLVDDGAPLRVVRPPEHLPMMAHWNFLIGELQAEWAILMSSDDLAEPVLVEELTAALASSPEAVIATGSVGLIDAEGTRLKSRRPRPQRVLRPPRNLRALLRGPRANLNATAFRTDAWRAVGGFPESFGLAGDWAFWVELSAHGSFVSTPAQVAHYRVQHRSSHEERARLVAWADDYRRLFREVFPRVAGRVGGVRPGEIDLALRVRCQNFLARLGPSLAETPDERERLATSLEEWAAACDVVEPLRRFRAGEEIPRARLRPLDLWLAKIRSRAVSTE